MSEMRSFGFGDDGSVRGVHGARTLNAVAAPSLRAGGKLNIIVILSIVFLPNVVCQLKQ